MVDVLLTHSYHLYFDRKQVRKMQPYPPLGTLYAAALLREHGFSAAVFDSMLEDPERGFPRALARWRPRIVTVYEDNFNFLSKMCLSRMRQVAYGMIDLARASGAKVLVNGSDSSDHLKECLARGADSVLLGEAEWTLLALVRALLGDANVPLEDIPGHALRRQSGAVFRTPPRPLMRDLDQLPVPARDLVEIDRYRDAWKTAHGFFSLNLVASRGCPYRCNWCAKPIYGDSFHVRSAESVAAEMQLLKETYGADHLWFADDTFGRKSRWLQELAASLARRAAIVPFKIQTRVDLMKEETVAALRRAGSESLITARGCPYHCRWCSHQVYGKTHRRRKPAGVVGEVEWILDRYPPDMLWFADDVFTIHHGWLFQYAAEMKRCGLTIPFECITRADRLNAQVADTLAELDCFRVWIGSESGSQRILDAMERGVRAEQVQQAVGLCKARGMETGMFRMWGYEGEAWEDIEATIEHVKRSNPDIFLTTVAYPIKGTPYFEQVAARVASSKAWQEGSDRDFRIRGRHSRRFFQFADQLLRAEVELHRATNSNGDSGAPLVAELKKKIVHARQGLRESFAEVEA